MSPIPERMPERDAIVEITLERFTREFRGSQFTKAAATARKLASLAVRRASQEGEEGLIGGSSEKERS
jgi:hypothetical protein